jgi:hypothetical protein
MYPTLNKTRTFSAVLKSGYIRIEDLRPGLGWTLTDDEAGQLVEAITAARKHPEKTNGKTRSSCSRHKA